MVCYECNEPGHYKNECPKLQKDRPKKNADKRKKVLMATWDDSESSDAASDSEDERENMDLMADAEHEDVSSESGSESDSEEVFSDLSREELAESLSEMFENYNQMKLKYKKLKRSLVSETENLKAEIVELNQNNSKLEIDLKLAQQCSAPDSEVSTKDILKEYDYSFQKFMNKIIDRSKMASMILE